MDNTFYHITQRANPMIVASARGDVTGDGVADNVYLTGVRTPNSPYIQNITLVVQDGRTGQRQTAGLKSNSGYDPTLFLGDFTGDGVDDILISIASGGSGGMTFNYVYSDAGHMLRQLFDYEVFNNTYQYDVQYLNHYRVSITNKTQNIRYIVDISYKGKEYLNEIYNSEGILKQPISGFVNPIGGVFPIDFDGNGVYELFIFQRVAGRYNADGLGFLQTTLSWNGRQFAFEDQYMAVYGGKAN